MHSLLGAVTLDLIIVVLATLFLVPIALKFLDSRFNNKKLFQFNGLDLRTHGTSTGVIIYSGLIGTLIHVLLDLFHLPYNPLTYPFEEYYNFNLVLFNDLFIANVLVQGVTGVLFFVTIYFWYLKDLK